MQVRMLWSDGRRAEYAGVAELTKARETLLVTDETERIVGVSQAWIALCGYAPADCWGRTPRELLHGPSTDRQAARDFAACTRNGLGRVSLVNYTKGGVPFRNHLRGTRHGDLLVAQTLSAEFI